MQHDKRHNTTRPKPIGALLKDIPGLPNPSNEAMTLEALTREGERISREAQQQLARARAEARQRAVERMIHRASIQSAIATGRWRALKRAGILPALVKRLRLLTCCFARQSF